MSYASKYGKRPDELASKSSHSHIINDEKVKEFITHCEYPKSHDQITLDSSFIFDIETIQENIIQHIITVDGGYSTIPVKKTFPSSLITFFQFGTLLLNIRDLDALSESPFISRESMSKLKDLERDKLVLPTKNVAYKKSLTLTESVRASIYEYFKNKYDGSSLLETLYWFIFQLYAKPVAHYKLASCPNCGENNILLLENSFNSDFKSPCKSCNRDIFLTDVFRFHEVIDDEIGAGGILGYLTNVVEHFNIIHTIKNILNLKPELIDSFLFLKDGPLAFFGQTANMHKPMRNLCNFLNSKYRFHLAGLEKSGAFVEHADEIKGLLHPGQVFLLSNRHIYTYILPGDPNTRDAYAKTSYYSCKIIFKTRENRMYVITIPVENENIVLNPKLSDFKNLEIILNNIEKLKCDMYDNAIVPVALANKLISLSNHPSSSILEKFAKNQIK